MKRALFVGLGVGTLVGTIDAFIPTEDGIALLVGIITAVAVTLFWMGEK